MSNSVSLVIDTSSECMLLGRIKVTCMVLPALRLFPWVYENRFSSELLVLAIFFNPRMLYSKLNPFFLEPGILHILMSDH